MVPEPWCQQVRLLHGTSCFCNSGGLKWSLFPVKNESFPFHNFRFTFFKRLDIFQCFLVAAIIMPFQTETHMSLAAKLRIHPRNAWALLSTLSPSPLGITQASSRFYPEVLTIPPDLLFVVKSSYYKTS